MSNIASEVLINALNWRYATKHFDPSKKLSDAQWNTLAQSLQLSPSSYGLQPWKILVVQSPEKRALLKAQSWNQPQIEECSHLAVFTTLKTVSKQYVQKYISNVSKTRGIPADQLKAYEDMMVGDIVEGPRSSSAQSWSQKQSYIAMGFLLETAALLGIDACPMEGLDPTQYDLILGLDSSDYKTVAVVALGFRAESDQYKDLKKVRPQLSELIEVV